MKPITRVWTLGSAPGYSLIVGYEEGRHRPGMYMRRTIPTGEVYVTQIAAFNGPEQMEAFILFFDDATDQVTQLVKEYNAKLQELYDGREENTD